ncbi:AAA family ATPase [Shewanella seohaensis]|uniref:AAA family ATPase n=1 Tax=Shewanella seohaensis TaxID=755175 RepID=A0ABV4VXE0_9GAMM
MQITKIYAQNYKGFKNLELNLNKLNVLIGKNGSGKSTITRLITLIIESLKFTGEDVINFSPLGIDIAGRYSELSYNGNDAGTIMLGAQFNIENEIYTFKTTLIYSTELNKVIVSKFEWFNNDESQFKCDLNSYKNREPVYVIGDEERSVIFNGLLPNVENTEFPLHRVKGLYKLYFSVNELKRCLTYLGPFRNGLSRVYGVNLGSKSNVGPRGEFAPYILNQDRNNPTMELHKKIESWMSLHFDGKYIYCDGQEPYFSLKVKSDVYSSNIVDDGVGYSQLFPLIVSRFSKLLNDSYGVEIVEQPELHLHPAVCGSVGDLYLDSFSENNNTVVLETHSKELLLRLRRRVAEGGIKGLENDISIVYVYKSGDSCCVDYINILRSGHVNWWPRGVFEESFDEVLAITEANNAN